MMTGNIFYEIIKKTRLIQREEESMRRLAATFLTIVLSVSMSQPAMAAEITEEPVIEQEQVVQEEQIQEHISQLLALMRPVIVIEGIDVLIDLALHAAYYVAGHLLLVPGTSVFGVTETLDDVIEITHVLADIVCLLKFVIDHILSISMCFLTM